MQRCCFLISGTLWCGEGIWGWANSHSFLANLFFSDQTHFFLFFLRVQNVHQNISDMSVFINHSLYSAVEDRFLLLYHKLLQYFLSSSRTQIFIRKVSLHALDFIVIFFSFFHITFGYFFYLQWMLIKSFLISDWGSCSVKSVVFWLGCEFKFCYYIFIPLDVFLSSYFPL